MTLAGDDTSSTNTRYETLRMLARGGMGSVEIVAVRKGGFRRLFALKRLRAELVSDARASAMLVEEGRIAGLLRHPNVVHVIDVGVDAQGPFLVMELVRGISAFDLFRWAKASGTPLDLQLVMRVIEHAALGLHAAHELVGDDGREVNLVHRDVSPQNIMVGFDGVARVADFGIAKALDVESHTTTGLLKGKAGYMAPEQLRFEPVDRRGDIFSLGIVLYELCAGERLYREEHVALSARRILHEPPPDLGAVRTDAAPGLVELGFECLAKDAEHRPQTAKAVATRLSELIAEDIVRRGAFDIEAFLAREFAERLRETRTWEGLADLRAIDPEAAALTERDEGLPHAGGPSGAVDGFATDPVALASSARPAIKLAARVLVLVLFLGTVALGVWTASTSRDDAPRAVSTPSYPSLRTTPLLERPAHSPTLPSNTEPIDPPIARSPSPASAPPDDRGAAPVRRPRERSIRVPASATSSAPATDSPAAPEEVW